jgi:hypothetical protein
MWFLVLQRAPFERRSSQEKPSLTFHVADSFTTVVIRMDQNSAFFSRADDAETLNCYAGLAMIILEMCPI